MEERNRLSYFILLIIFLLVSACKSHNNSVGLRDTNKPDSVIYSLKEYNDIDNKLDSLLFDKPIEYCYFEISKYIDTVAITFVYNDTENSYYQENYTTNRFIVISNKLYMILNKEDFIFQRPSKNTIIEDPKYIKIYLSYPAFNLLQIEQSINK